MKSAIIIMACVTSFTLVAHAVLHISGQHMGPKDYVRSLTKEVKRVGPDGLPVIRRVISPPTGTHNVAVILVDFPSAGSSTSGSRSMTSTDITGLGNTFSYLANYYAEASYGKLNINITYFYQGGSSTSLTGAETPYQMIWGMEHYGTGDETGSSAGLVNLITEALQKVSSITSASYSSVLVAHAGYGNESTYPSSNGDIWSAVVDWDTAVQGFTDGGTFPVRENAASPIGVTIHEFGHLLGFVDLYDTILQTSKVGKWCLYDQGTWINAGATPVHPCVWEKVLVGWIDPMVVEDEQQMTSMLPVERSSTTVYSFPVLGNTDEYFLVCYSTKTTYNPAPVGGGMLIWHIDERDIDGVPFSARIENNTVNNYSHNTVDIVPAGSSHPQDSPYGSAQDPWPGTKGVFTSPYSNSYDDVPSGISIGNFSFSGQYARMDAQQIAAGSTADITKLINYPNPAGSGYEHPRQNNGIITTLVMHLRRPPENLSLDIFTLNGEKIRTVSDTNNFSMRVGFGEPSSDYRWVYEYDWDGKNETGEDVAPGVYFYRVKADRDKKIGTMAIVR